MTSVWYIVGGIGFMIMLIVFVTVGDIPITEFQMVGAVVVLLLVGAGGGAWYFFKNMNFSSSDSMDVFKAVDYAIKHANKQLDMNLVKVKAGGGVTSRSFFGDSQTYYGLILRRSYNDMESPGQLVSCIIGSKPIKVLEFNDNPTPQHLSDPFHTFSAGFAGSPSPKANPQGDSGFLRDQYRNQNRSGTSIMINQPKDDFFGNNKEE